MLPNIRPVFLVIVIMGLLAGCVSPAPAATALVLASTSTSLPPTEAVPTATSSSLGIPGVQVPIPVGEGNETINATITGNGGVGLIFANTVGYDSSRWLPLVEALDGNENLRLATFTYRNEDVTPVEDTRAVFDYLRAEGIDKVICVGAVYGARSCGYLQTESEIAGMVFFTNAHIPVIVSNFPKLFLAGSSDFGDLGTFQSIYDQSAEPKLFKSYDSGRNGPGLFTDPSVGPQVLADITDFINGIVNGR